MTFRTIFMPHDTHVTAPGLRCTWGTAGLTVSLGVIGATEAKDVLVYGQRYTFQLGEDADAGRARIIRDRMGRAYSRLGANGGRIQFGIIPDIDPGTPQKKEDCLWRVIDEKTIEITLPEWASKDRDGRTCNKPLQVASAPTASKPKAALVAAPQAPAPVPAVAPPARVTPAPPPTNGVRREVIKGVTVSFAVEDESISFGDKIMDVTAGAAKLATRLLSGAPNPVGRNFLCKALYPGMRSDEANVKLANDAQGLKPALEAIGLKLNVVKGIGFAIGGLS